MPRKRPEYRGDREHTAFLGKLRNYLPTVEDFEARIEDQLREKFEVTVFDYGMLMSSVKTLLGETQLEQVARTKVESIEDHLRKMAEIPSLVRTGPSCTNIT
jgi:hypothetical protein